MMRAAAQFGIGFGAGIYGSNISDTFICGVLVTGAVVLIGICIQHLPKIKVIGP